MNRHVVLAIARKDLVDAIKSLAGGASIRIFKSDRRQRLFALDTSSLLASTMRSKIIKTLLLSELLPL
jgi:hypothetical protein